MKKSMLLIFMEIFIIGLLTGCMSSNKVVDNSALAVPKVEVPKEVNKKFVKVYDSGSSDIQKIDIYVDTDTGVEYVCTYSAYGGKNFEQRVGADGKPIINVKYTKPVQKND